MSLILAEADRPAPTTATVSQTDETGVVPTSQARLPRVKKNYAEAPTGLESQISAGLLSFKPIKKADVHLNWETASPTVTIIMDLVGKDLAPAQKGSIRFLIGQISPQLATQNIYLINEKGFPLGPLPQATLTPENQMLATLGQITSAVSGSFSFLLASQMILLLFLIVNFFMLWRFTRARSDQPQPGQLMPVEMAATNFISNKAKHHYGLAAALRNQFNQTKEPIKGSIKDTSQETTPASQTKADTLPPSPEMAAGNLEEKLLDLTPREIFALLENEKPSTIAFVLSFLEPPSEELVINFYPENTQEDIRLEFSRLGTVDTEIIRATQKILENPVSRVSPTAKPALVNYTPAQPPAPGLEEILFLPDWQWRAALSQVTPQLAALSLKTASPELTKKIFRNLPPQWKEVVAAEMNLADVVLLKDVEQAQNGIVEKILTLRYNPASPSHAN